MTVQVQFWGVRGSIPSPGPDTVLFGGNTACISVRTPDAAIVLDAGSGIREYGKHVLRDLGATGHTITLLVSHTHWDHIQGLPFFAPAFGPGNNLTIAGPEIYSPGFRQVIEGQMQHSYFPLRFKNMGATIKFRELTVGVYDDLVPGARVRTMATNHPVVDLAYRIEVEGRVIVYLMDYECWTEAYSASVRRSSDANVREIEMMVRDDLNAETRAFIEGADILVADAALTRTEYPPRVGWGHSTFDDILALTAGAHVGKLVFSHHDPNRTDRELEALEEEIRRSNAASGNCGEVLVAREGMRFEL